MADKTTAIGLDIGSSHARAIQLKPTRNGHKIEKWGEIQLEHGAIQNGIIQDPQSVANSLKELWKKAGFTTNQVRLGQGGDPVVTTSLIYDDFTDEDFSKALPFIFAEHTPFERDEYLLDYHTLARFTVKEKDEDGDPIIKNKRHVVICGGKKEAINSLIETTKLAKLKPVSIDINGFALIRAHHPTTLQPQRNLADVSIDIGANVTSVVIHKNGQLLFARDITGAASNQINQELMKEFGISWEKAENRKMETLYTNTEHLRQQTQNTLPNPNPANNLDRETLEAKLNRITLSEPYVSAGLRKIILEIRQTLAHFQETPAGREYSAYSGITFSGGASTTHGLAVSVGAEWQVPTEIAQPFTRNQHKNAPENEQAYLIAYGLATGEGSTHS